MNPPSALSGAMSRERKPFTYTPGGLDLSEIKSERMAKRLMRNAMNQGVPEKPVQVQSSATTAAPVALPNYNCLPVQVFPAFNLPANPKALLRTRSNPDPKDAPQQRVIPPPFVNNARIANNDTFNKNPPTYSEITNYRPTSMYEYNTLPSNINSNIPQTNYEKDVYTPSVLPEMSYDAEYLQAPSKFYSEIPIAQLPKLEIIEGKEKKCLFNQPLPQQTLYGENYKCPFYEELPKYDVNLNKECGFIVEPKQEVSEDKYKLPVYEQLYKKDFTNDQERLIDNNNQLAVNNTLKQDVLEEKDHILKCNDHIIEEERFEDERLSDDQFYKQVEVNNKDNSKIIFLGEKLQDTPNPLVEATTLDLTPELNTKTEEETTGRNEQREVNVVQKQVTKENVEEQNGDQNGGDNVEAQMTVKLPTKKSAAKTETKVEVVKKTLPDGSIEEVKTTTTKTTIDGKTEIKTKIETTIIPQDAESEEEIEEEVEEEDEEVVVQEVVKEQQMVEEPEEVTVISTNLSKENGQETKVIKSEEKSESTTIKKVVVVQEPPKQQETEDVEEEEEIEEEVEEAEPVTIVLKKQPTPERAVPAEKIKPAEEVEDEEEVEEEIQEEIKPVNEEVVVESKEEEEIEEELAEVKEEVTSTSIPQKEEEEEEVEEEFVEAEETETKAEETEAKTEETEAKADEIEVTVEKTAAKAEVTLEKIEIKETEEKESTETVEEVKEKQDNKELSEELIQEPVKTDILEEKPESPSTKEVKPEPAPQTEYKIPIREPSVPLEKVEDVEIKPIGATPIITKSHTENTEIITSTIDPKGGLSTQTEYNKVENIVTVNRTTKILDHSYENLTQQGIPTVKTYFATPSIDRISTSPLPSRPYQPVYPPASAATSERRHSLLLERLSMERQMPSDIYQYSTASQEQTQYGEPQSEVLTVSNVKPSTISNSQWYTNQQTQLRQQNTIYNNVSSTPTPASQPWAQPKSPVPQPQQHYQSQQQYQPPQQQHQQPQQQYQPPQQQYQPPQQQYQPPQQQYKPPQQQYQPQPQPQYQPSAQPQYQPSYTEPTPERAPSSYSAYTPTPTWVSNSVENPPASSLPTQYSYTSKETDSYQKTTQNYSSSYVPPPWEQDSSYANYTQQDPTQNLYQSPQQTNTYSPAPVQGWKPEQSAKYSKNAPIAYVPPAPNQSFVKPVPAEPPRVAGRKTYYSEYERRYITVPESTYIPTETKFQPQPDPSPQYYYDNSEPVEEAAEPQWRRELREFTEKTSQTTTETTSVQPPWEADSYAKAPPASYTATPTWSQTLRPSSWRERSFESELPNSQEWPKTNTLGRGRPLSTLGKSVDSSVPERVRGVSVDRYNPNNYQPPAEHPPVPSHTFTTPAPHTGHHNPNVPGYHSRASAEPRELPSSYQHRVYRESRASPLQSRSFKYLQWITGTEN